MSTETKFETFWTALGQSPYELPVEIKPHLLTTLKLAGFFDAPTTVVTSVVPTATQTKKLSGYNVFMKVKMVELFLRLQLSRPQHRQRNSPVTMSL
jgi:hypothetical protein